MLFQKGNPAGRGALKIGLFLLLTLVDATAQTNQLDASQLTNIFTFTNKYKEVIHAQMTSFDSQGIVYKETDGPGLGKVAFTNVSEEVQKRYGYDAEKIRKIAAEKSAKAKAAEEERLAKERASQYDSVEKHLIYLIEIDESDFPKTDKAKEVCLEVVAELNGIQKALELGISYTKFSELLTEKALAIQKAKDLRAQDVPSRFFSRVDRCIDQFSSSKKVWADSIAEKYPSVKVLEEWYMQQYWSKAELNFIYCSSMAKGDTNSHELAVTQLAKIIKAEQLAVKNDILPFKDYFDPVVSGMTTDQIANQIMRRLASTNSVAPPTKSKGAL